MMRCEAYLYKEAIAGPLSAEPTNLAAVRVNVINGKHSRCRTPYHALYIGGKA